MKINNSKIYDYYYRNNGKNKNRLNDIYEKISAGITLNSSERELLSRLNEIDKIRKNRDKLMKIKRKGGKNTPLTEEESDFLRDYFADEVITRYSYQDLHFIYIQNCDLVINNDFTKNNHITRIVGTDHFVIKNDLARLFGTKVDDISIFDEKNYCSKLHYGNINLGAKTYLNGTRFSETVYGDLIADEVETASYVHFPKNIYGNLILGSLTESTNNHFPTLVFGNVDLRSLKNTDTQLCENVYGLIDVRSMDEDTYLENKPKAAVFYATKEKIKTR